MNRLTAITIMVVAACFSIAGVTISNAATSSDPIYEACHLGAKFLYDYTNGPCPTGYKKIVWDQQGPSGPVGATGKTGATGATGSAGPSTAGPSGLDVVEVTVSGGQDAIEEIAQCPASNPYLIGGGGYAGGWMMNESSGIEALNINGAIQPAQWVVTRELVPGQIKTGYGMSASTFCAK